MQYTIEQMADYILFLGPKEWTGCKASVIINDILSAFSERAGQDVQLAHIWDDMTFDYLHIEQPTRISEVLDMIARYTGSCVLYQSAQVSFMHKKEKEWTI